MWSVAKFSAWTKVLGTGWHLAKEPNTMFIIGTETVERFLCLGLQLNRDPLQAALHLVFLS
jgi:hypothetical protein